MASAPMLVHAAAMRRASLVIAVGDFAAALLRSTETVLRQDDPRRLTTLGFYRVVAAGDRENDLKLEAVGEVQAQGSSSLEAVLHDLRLHEKFLQAGLGDEQELSLGVILLADLTEPGSESLYPLIRALNEQMANEPGSYKYMLCKTAIFAGNPAKKLMQARLHLHLRELTTLARETGLKPQTYLFDGLKEGLLEAKDEFEIGVLMQNFLLALLSGRLAQRLAHVYALADDGEEETLFNSASATALIYEPAVLQEECARQLAVETLETELLSETVTDPARIETTMNGILESIGTVSTWAEDLCEDTPFQATAAESIILDLHFSDLQFEGLPPQEWGDAIVGHAEYFRKELQANHFETLQKNAPLIGQAISTALEVEISALPARSNLYPGGIANSLQVIQGCVRKLSEQIQSCQPAQNEEEALRWLEKEYASAGKSLDQAIGDLPDPPRWVKRLPGKLYLYAKMLFEFLFLRSEHARLVVLREKLIQALEAKFIFEFEQRLRRSIVELCSQLISSLEKSHSELNALRAKFQDVKDHLQGPPRDAILEPSPFRIQLVTPALLEWAYARGDKDVTEIRAELLQSALPEDWRNISEENLRVALVSACRSAYAFLNGINAETVLKETDLSDLPTSVVLLAQGAVPALRPDFDLSGESLSYSANYLLCGDPRESDIPDILKDSAREWQEVATGDPYMILFCRVRQMIPIGALFLLFRSAQAAFEDLSEQEQKELQDAFPSECS